LLEISAGESVSPERAFGQVLQRHRTLRGLSQERLAAASSLDRTFISLLERGRRQPSLATLISLASALGTTASHLLQEVEAVLKEVTPPSSTE
jgi:transcriptional regulator with XRE-family HTH domain